MTNIYTYPFMKQQINFKPSIAEYVKTDEKKLKILGFFNKTPSSVQDFNV